MGNLHHRYLIDQYQIPYNPSLFAANERYITQYSQEVGIRAHHAVLFCAGFVWLWIAMKNCSKFDEKSQNRPENFAENFAKIKMVLLLLLHLLRHRHRHRPRSVQQFSVFDEIE